MLDFTYKTRRLNVVFADGAVNAMASHVEETLGARRVLVVSTPGRKPLAESVLTQFGSGGAALFAGAQLHVPRSVVAEARDLLSESRADCVVAVGGGSAIGVAKALVVETGHPLVAVPTTYSGSEMTAIWGTTGPDGKRTGRDERAAPQLVLYDPSLTRTMPRDVAGPSGVNAIAHAVEALYSQAASPVSSALAAEGIRRMAAALPVDSHDEALCGAHLCGVALEMTTMGLHHKLCHVLGGTLNLPHALTHAIVLPHAAAYNAKAAPAAMAVIADALRAGLTTSTSDAPATGGSLGTDDFPGGSASPDPLDAARGLWRLNKQLGITQTLADLGMREADIDMIARKAMALSYPNPALVTEAGVRGILERAYRGIESSDRLIV